MRNELGELVWMDLARENGPSLLDRFTALEERSRQVRVQVRKGRGR